MTDTVCTIDELFSRDPLSLSEEDLLETTRLLIHMNREVIRTWNTEKAVAAAAGKQLSGPAVKKKQLSAERQAALSFVPSIDL